MNELATVDVKEMSPAQLGGEIRLLTMQARRMALSYGIQIGYRLHIAHEKVGPHGWAEWLKKETDFSAASASRFEALYEGYGEDQGNLFGVGNKFPTLENISISNALSLLAVPEEEREQVAAELGAESLSKRELDKALKERDEAQKRVKELENELAESEDGHGLAITELEEQIDALRADAVKGKEALKERAGLLDQLDRAEHTEKELRSQIHELETRPQPVAIERDEKAIEEAVTAAKAAASAEWAEKVQKLQADLEKANAQKDKLKAKVDKADAAAGEKISAAEQETARIRQELEDARRQLKLANADVTAFGIHFTAGQKELLEAFASLEKIAERDLTTAQKLNGGFSKLLQMLADRVKVLQEKAAAAPITGRTELEG